jgi:hypothetical protein
VKTKSRVRGAARADDSGEVVYQEDYVVRAPGSPRIAVVDMTELIFCCVVRPPWPGTLHLKLSA